MGTMKKGSFSMMAKLSVNALVFLLISSPVHGGISGSKGTSRTKQNPVHQTHSKKKKNVSNPSGVDTEISDFELWARNLEPLKTDSGTLPERSDLVSLEITGPKAPENMDPEDMLREMAEIKEKVEKNMSLIDTFGRKDTPREIALIGELGVAERRFSLP